MHDHLRELGREMADKIGHPRRLWRFEHLQSLESKGFKGIITQSKFRCLHSFADPSAGFRFNFFLGESNNTLEPSTDLLCLEIEGSSMHRDFLPWIPLQNLRCLKITNLRGSWQSYVKTPNLLKELLIWGMDLQELSLGFLGCLEKLEIGNCRDLKRLTGISVHTRLAELTISNCGGLENIRFHKLGHIKLITIHRCWRLEIWTGISELPTLEELNIFGCHKLEFEESSLCHLHSLKKIQIYRCENLKNLSAITQDTKLVELKIGQCQKIEELSLVRLTHLRECFISDVLMLQRIEVKGCGNLQEFHGRDWSLVKLDIHDCPGLENMTNRNCFNSLVRLQLCYCSKRTIQNCLKTMEKMPSEFFKIIGEAANGAESDINASLVWNFNITDSVIQIGVEKTCNHLGRHVCAIVLCAVVRVNSYAAAESVNKLLKEYDLPLWLKFEVRQGEWMINFVTMREDDIQNDIVNQGCGFLFDFLDSREDMNVTMVSKPVRKGDEHKIRIWLCQIVEELYQSSEV